jgi:hypothetical protein
MKFTLSTSKKPAEYWNGTRPLPAEISVLSYNVEPAEFELLAIICGLHGYITAFDLVIGSNDNTEKDKDIQAVMTAFQMYILPKMPLSKYSASEKRIKLEDCGKMRNKSSP